MDIVLYDNDALISDNTGWSIRHDCPWIMEATRSHIKEEYQEQMAKIKFVNNASNFWIGFLANKGKDEIGHGEMTRVAEETGHTAKDVWDAAWVYRQFKTSVMTEVYNEYPDLAYGVFRVCASLETDEEKLYWLKHAGKHKLSAPKLRIEMKEDEWEPRYFNHWSSFPIESWQNRYPGQIPGEILKNVLHYATEEDDFVIDVFGGGGNMGLTCDRMNRYHVAYDINPQFPNIKKHNALHPFPDNNANLVFLDPPYWGQKRGEYDGDPTDLSNIPTAEQFHALLKQVCDNAKQALKPGGYLVLIIGSSQTKDYFVDHAAEMYAILKDDWIHKNSVAAAYPTTQYSGNDVQRAKDNKYMLNLYTTIQFWQKDDRQNNIPNF